MNFLKSSKILRKRYSFKENNIFKACYGNINTIVMYAYCIFWSAVVHAIFFYRNEYVRNCEYEYVRNCEHRFKPLFLMILKICIKVRYVTQLKKTWWKFRSLKLCFKRHNIYHYKIPLNIIWIWKEVVAIATQIEKYNFKGHICDTVKIKSSRICVL